METGARLPGSTVSRLVPEPSAPTSLRHGDRQRYKAGRRCRCCLPTPGISIGTVDAGEDAAAACHRHPLFPLSHAPRDVLAMKIHMCAPVPGALAHRDAPCILADPLPRGNGEEVITVSCHPQQLTDITISAMRVHSRMRVGVYTQCSQVDVLEQDLSRAVSRTKPTLTRATPFCRWLRFRTTKW